MTRMCTVKTPVKTPWKVGLLGECMVELQGTPEGHLTLTFGGDTFNTAAYLARTGAPFGVDVEYISAVGDDGFSTSMIHFWQQQGVKASLTRRLPNRLPGLYHIEVEPCGERVFSYWRGESAAKDSFSAPGWEAVLDSLGGFQALYLSGISLAILREDGRERLLQRLEALARAGTDVFFDGNFRPRLWQTPQQSAEEAARPWYLRTLAISRAVLLTMDETPVLHPDFQAYASMDAESICRRIAAMGPKEVVLKNGADSCIACHEGAFFSVPAVRLDKVVDTTAAGDSFAAAYILGRHLGLAVPEAIGRAHTLAGCVVSHRGAVIPKEVTPPLFDDLITG